MKKKIVIICITILIWGLGVLLIWNFNRYIPEKRIEVSNTRKTTLSSTITPTTTKVSKKVSKTIKNKKSELLVKIS